MSILWRPDLTKPSPFGFDSIDIMPGLDVKSRIAVTTAPAEVGGKSLRFTLRAGEIVNNGNRTELVKNTNPPEGTERAFAFSVLFPAAFPTMAGQWQVFCQWHQSEKFNPATGKWDTTGRSPPVEFALNGDTMQLNLNGPKEPYAVRTLWSAPLIRDRWLRFVVHVRWSSGDGWIRAFLDGKEILKKTAGITMFAPYTVYLKMGLYRDQDIKPEAILYHADIAEADKLEDLLPPATPAVPTVPPPITTTPAPVWRVGRKLGRTLYVDDQFVGTVDTPELAAAIVAAMNAKQ